MVPHNEWMSAPAAPTEQPGDTPPRQQPAGPRRVPLLYVGISLVVVGAALLGYLGWQYWGTNIVSGHRQDQVTAELISSWNNPAVDDLLGPDSGAELGNALALIRIPRFGRDYVIPLIEGVRPEDLAQGIGHYPGTALPGQIGNLAMAGHRVTNGEPFQGFFDLQPGDRVLVETSDAVYTYVLDTDPGDLTVLPDDTWVIDRVPVAPPGEAPPGMPVFPTRKPSQPLLTMTTCSEQFHTEDRSIVFGHLVDTRRK